MTLIATLIIFVLLILGIMKKINLNLLLLGETLLILIFLTITKGSVLGEATTGNMILDMFAYIANYLASNIGGVVFSMIFVSAYVEVMKHLGATTRLANTLSKAVGKIHSRPVVIGLVILISALMRTCITSGPAEVILLLATFYPVMLACGCSVETACAAILVSNAICWGPADPIDLAASKLMGIEVNMAEWFIRYQLPVFCVIFLVAIIVFLIIYRSFDAKHATMTDPEMTTSADGGQAPGIYALLPLLPLVIMLVFSPFCLKMISIDINGAVTLSLMITMIVVAICSAGSKTGEKAAHKMTMTEIITSFVAGFCDSMKGLGMTVLFAMLFAASLNSIGGMAVIAEALMKMKMAPLLLILIVCIFSGVINIVVGSFIGALSIAEPIAATVAAATGISAPLMCFFVVISCGAGCICSPVNPMVLILSKKMNTMELIKRVAAPIWCGVLAAIIFGTLVLV